MANLEVSSAIAEISASISGEVEVSSIVLELSSIIPDGEAAVASLQLEVSVHIPDPEPEPEIPPEYVKLTETIALPVELHVVYRRKSRTLTGVYEVI